MAHCEDLTSIDSNFGNKDVNAGWAVHFEPYLNKISEVFFQIWSLVSGKNLQETYKSDGDGQATDFL